MTAGSARIRILLSSSLIVLAPSWLLAAGPVVGSFTAQPPSVAPGEVVQLEVSAQDPDCAGSCTSGCGQTIRADLTAWTATGGVFLTQDNGVTGSPYTARAEWEAPASEDTYTIAVSLSDSGTFMCGGRSTVTAEVTVLVTTSTNQIPHVESVTAAPAQLFPDQTSELVCAAWDPEGDPLSYTWSTDSGGVTPGDAGTAMFQAGPPGIATVTCSVADSGGATASGTTGISVTDAVPEASLTSSLGTPQRVAVDSRGDVFVADRAGGGLAVLDLWSGELVYHLPLPGVSSVAVDWEDRLLVGGVSGARVVDRRGGLVLALDPGTPLGDVSDVAVDLVNQRYAVLHRSAARVNVYDASGLRIAAFGSNGDGPRDLKRPLGLAVTPTGWIVVGDSGHGRVKIFDLDGTLRLDFGGLGAGVGEFVQLDDVGVGANGVIYASDAYQDWVQTFNPDGSLREVLGTFGEGVGRFMTPTGVAPADAFQRLVVASVNSSSLQVFRLSDDPVPQPSPSPRLSLDALSFGLQAVGTVSETQLVTLANPGAAPLGIHGIEVEGDFIQTNDCHLFVDAGEICSLRLTFAPQAPGARPGSLAIETSAGPEIVSLAGEAFVPATLQISPESLAFADQPVGTVSDPETVRLTNGGTVGLGISDVGVTPGFGVVNGCGALLAGGASCTLGVFFAPAEAADSIPGTLTIVTSPGGPRTAALEGRGVLFDVSVVPSTVDFGSELVDTESEPQTITVTNVGGDFAEVGPVTLEGAEAGAFLIRSDLCSGARLEVGEACDLGLTFRPLDQRPHSATIRVPSNAGDSPDLVSLLGRGRVAGETEQVFADDFESGSLSAWSTVVPPVLEIAGAGAVASSTVDFGAAPVGGASPLNITVLNAGDSPLSLGPMELAGARPQDFRVDSERCLRRRFSRDAVCVVGVTFVPTEEGRSSAELHVKSATGEILGVATLTGTGVGPRVEEP